MIELAEVRGIRLLSAYEYNPFKAHIFGKGEFIIETIVKGAQTIYLTVGGPATIDGGFGTLKTLRADFLDELGHNVAVTQLADLRSVAALNLDLLKKNLYQISIKVLVDVENTLCWIEGAMRFLALKGSLFVSVTNIWRLIQHLGDLLTTALNKIFWVERKIGWWFRTNCNSRLSSTNKPTSQYVILINKAIISEKLLSIDFCWLAGGR